MTVSTQSGVSPIGYWTGCYRKYATFTGRARRAEYWWFVLFNFIIYFLLIMAGLAIGSLTSGDAPPALVGVLVAVYLAVVFVPTTAVVCRRLHDAGLSGWWQLLGIIPGGSIAILVMTILPGNPGTNQYGPDPR